MKACCSRRCFPVELAAIHENIFYHIMLQQIACGGVTYQHNLVLWSEESYTACSATGARENQKGLTTKSLWDDIG